MKNYIKSKLILDIIVILITTLMIFISEILNEKEIIFPEIAALLVGSIMAPRKSWNVNNQRMLMLITACSLIGLSLSMYLDTPLIVKLPLTFFISQLILLYSGTSFAPLISATVLPVLLRCESIIYPISSISFTIVIILLEMFIIKRKFKEDREFIPVPCESIDITNMLIRVIFITVVSTAMLYLGFKFVLAPPLLVAFTEFSSPSSKAREHFIKAIFVVSACGLVGCLARYALTITLGAPLFVAALAAITAVVIIMRLLGMFLPPAGALAILPMLVPQDSLLLYPVQICAGVTIYMIFALLVFKKN